MPKEINNLKITMAELQKDISYIKESIKKNDIDHEIIINKIDHWIDGCENKFAAKWVETTITWIGRIVFGAIILAILGLIINQNV